jgi:hypothetical protein
MFLYAVVYYHKFGKKLPAQIAPKYVPTTIILKQIDGTLCWYLLESYAIPVRGAVQVNMQWSQ